MRGVGKRGNKLRVYVKVGHLQRETHQFPVGTDPKKIRRWREDTRRELEDQLPKKGESGSMHAEADRYLVQVKAMPTYSQRRDHIQMWVDALGPETPRRTVTPEDIRTVLQGWRAAGLGPATCNKRRSALMHLWSTLDGKGLTTVIVLFRPAFTSVMYCGERPVALVQSIWETPEMANASASRLPVFGTGLLRSSRNCFTVNLTMDAAYGSDSKHVKHKMRRNQLFSTHGSKRLKTLHLRGCVYV